MNIEPLWTLVDQYRKMADGIERQIRVVTGDLPEEEPGTDLDRIEAYTLLVRTLAECAGTLHEFADSEGRHISRRRAAKARVMAHRCTRALENLAKAGEL